MKKCLLLLTVVLASAKLFAQTNDATEVTSRNSWLKVGINAGVPVGELANYSTFTLGAELKGQLMETKHIGLGLTAGYNHFFTKSGYDDFGSVPVGAFIRYYPKYRGFFVGTDLGYTFVTGVPDGTGGVYARPQLGYHNYSWNIFGFYNGVFRGNDDGGNLQYVGIGATYNIHFRKKR
jgi:hypothetical protein